MALTVDGPHEAEDATLWELDAGTGGFHGPVASLGVEFRPEFAVSAELHAPRVGARVRVRPGRRQRGGRATLVLRSAGFLRIERDVHPPEGVALCVRRRRTAAVLGTADADQPWLFRDVVLGRPAVVIGPFPEGDVTFAVCYAGTDIDGLTVGTGAELCEFTAHVVAGTTTRVVLPLAQLGAK